MAFALRLGGGLFVGCALLLVATIGTVRVLNPPTPAALLFTNPDGSACQQPCMFGIRPGETVYETAIALLRAHPLTRDLVMEPSIGRNGVIFLGRDLGVGLSRDLYAHLTMIDLQVEPPGARRHPDLPLSPFGDTSLGEMLLALGAPDYVQFSQTRLGGAVTLYYQTLHLRITHGRHARERIDPYVPVQYLFMYTQPAVVEPGMFAWRGFTTFQHYYDATYN